MYLFSWFDWPSLIGSVLRLRLLIGWLLRLQNSYLAAMRVSGLSQCLTTDQCSHAQRAACCGTLHDSIRVLNALNQPVPATSRSHYSIVILFKPCHAGVTLSWRSHSKIVSKWFRFINTILSWNLKQRIFCILILLYIQYLIQSNSAFPLPLNYIFSSSVLSLYSFCDISTQSRPSNTNIHL